MTLTKDFFRDLEKKRQKGEIPNCCGLPNRTLYKMDRCIACYWDYMEQISL